MSVAVVVASKRRPRLPPSAMIWVRICVNIIYLRTSTDLAPTQSLLPSLTKRRPPWLHKPNTHTHIHTHMQPTTVSAGVGVTVKALKIAALWQAKPERLIRMRPVFGAVSKSPPAASLPAAKEQDVSQSVSSECGLAGLQYRLILYRNNGKQDWEVTLCKSIKCGFNFDSMRK